MFGISLLNGEHNKHCVSCKDLDFPAFLRVGYIFLQFPVFICRLLEISCIKVFGKWDFPTKYQGERSVFF